MIITPGAAYLSPLRSVVAGEDQVVRLTLQQATTGALVSIDGQWDLEMAVGDAVEVRALAVPLRLIEPTGSVACWSHSSRAGRRLPTAWNRVPTASPASADAAWAAEVLP